MLVFEQMCHVGECICHQPKATYCISTMHSSKVQMRRPTYRVG